MKLIAIKLRNFRAYNNETTVTLDDFTVLIGRNDAGKSSLLDALDIFFNDAEIEKILIQSGNDLLNEVA